MEWLRVAPYTSLQSHTRFLLTLRSKEDHYHSLILFRLANTNGLTIPQPDAQPASSTEDDVLSGRLDNMNLGNDHQLYAMESSCPHLGADMSHAEIEECEDSYVAVCPWHRYDFDLKTGKSETGLRACTYDVQLRSEEGHDQVVYVETPSNGTEWRLVELRPVSEEFADPPPEASTFQSRLPLPHVPQATPVDEPMVPETNPPTTLMQWAVLILNTANPTLKVQRTRHAVHLFRTGKLVSIGHKASNAPTPPEVPPREEKVLQNTVDPAKVRNRKNRAVMLHALANIEQWAIDLAWDIMARFGPMHPDLPPAFFSDFAKVAEDEAKHFSLLTSRLHETSPSTPYGSLPVHASLWASASTTSQSLLSRLAIIHLVHEARGLDVNPGTIEKFRKAGDMESVKVMEIIHADEVTHVTAGHRWFVWLCERDGGTKVGGMQAKLDPVTVFREEVRRGWRGDIKGPFNVEAREKAGMGREFYEGLRGELGIHEQKGRIVEDKHQDEKNPQAEPEVRLEYENAVNV
ncbi:DUF455-domain-containing protein [Pluteus cervinus]|uniref:DUF455-domain-containing protein n=1 Tax=Pluteus cervinus TaxID=181527 RepID=A0ACD3AZB4_9AGAR|nr:DUF455-domain-containing protein [Pluteus cervinus]